MRIPSGKTDQLIYFVAVDSVDLKTRKTGLTSFTVYRSRNGGAATAYTTPTVTELSAANMPGVYALTVDEDTTIASTSDSEEYCVHITQASMAPVTRTIELYRRTATTGETIAASSGAVSTVTTVNGLAANTITAASMAADASAEIAAAVWDMDATAHQTDGTFGQAIGDAAGDDSIFTYSVNILGAINGLNNLSAIDVSNALTTDFSGIADDIFDAPDAVETGLTLRQWLRLMAAANLGKVSGFSTGSPVYRDVNDTKNRITATTTADGRSAVTLDAA